MLSFKQVSQIGVVTLWVSGVAMVVSLLISFGYAHQFSLGEQIVAHIVTIVAAGFFKLGYVAYIAGRYERNLAI